MTFEEFIAELEKTTKICKAERQRLEAAFDAGYAYHCDQMDKAGY